MLRVFLCHSSADKPAVRRLRDTLLAAGFFPWLDEEELLPGDPWEEKIRRAIRQSDAVVICLSPSCVSKRGFVQREIRDAVRVAEEVPGDRAFLIPAMIALCELPESLSHLHCVDLTQEGGINRLIRALALLEAQRNEPNEHLAKDLIRGLFASDSTEFAADLKRLLTAAYFDLEEIGRGLALESKVRLGTASIVCIVRGEGYSSKGNDQLFSELTAYVHRGGVLIATAWTGWENYHSGALSPVLPVHLPSGIYLENRIVTVRPTERGMAQRLFPQPFKIRISYEKAVPADEATVLLETEDGVPIVALRAYGEGRCVYLNVCQHTCQGSMASPLAGQGSFRAGIGRLVETIRDDLRQPVP